MPSEQSAAVAEPDSVAPVNVSRAPGEDIVTIEFGRLTRTDGSTEDGAHFQFPDIDAAAEFSAVLVEDLQKQIAFLKG